MSRLYLYPRLKLPSEHSTPLRQRVKPTGVERYNTIDKQASKCYYVTMINITNTIKQKYYTYRPGEFLPVYMDGQLANKRAFHAYRLRWIIKNRRVAVYQFTHYAG